MEVIEVTLDTINTISDIELIIGVILENYDNVKQVLLTREISYYSKPINKH